MRLAVVLALELALVSCRREDVVARPDDAAPRHVEIDAAVELPRVRVLADIEEHHGKRVVVEGRYEVEPIARGKGGKRVWIVLVDGTHISRAYDLVPAELPYAGRRVNAMGIVTSGPPSKYVQALSGPHLKLERLELRAGEPPLDETITDVPAPPVGSTTPSLAGSIDRWVQLVATLTAVSADDAATLKLSDGGLVRVDRVQPALWTPLIGKTVTVTGKLAMEKSDTGAFSLDLVIHGPTAICPGVTARCGL